MKHLSRRCTGQVLALALLILLGFQTTALATTRDVTTFGATGNSSSDDTAAINSAISALQTGDQLYFPCGTYRTSSGLKAVTVANVTVAGQTGCTGAVTILSTAGGAVLTIGKYGVSASTPLTVASAELSPTIQANFASIGAASGDFILIEQGTTSSHTCGGSGCRGEVLQIQSMNGNTATVATAVHQTYDPACCAAWVKKILSPLSGVTVHDLVLDGSGTSSTGLSIANTVNSTFTNVTVQNVVGSGGPNNSGALAANLGYNLSFNDISINRSCTYASNCGAAFSLYQQGNPTVNGATLTNLNLQAFGFIPFEEANGTFTNVTVDGTGATMGRAVKLNSATYNTFNGLVIKNISANAGGYNGLSLEYFSAHNTFNDCSVTNVTAASNTTNGIQIFGDSQGNSQGSNHYNTFNNCSVSGAQTYQVFVLDHNDHLEFNGGTYTGTGERVFGIGDYACCSNFDYIHDVTIRGPGQAIYIGGTNACINNNTLVASSGLSSGIQVQDSTSVGSGNVLNGASNNLTAGTCGTTSPSATRPAPPTGLTATVN